MDEASLVQELQQLGLPKENSEAIGRQYREHKDSLRSTLTDDSYRLSKFKSLDWRVDYILDSSESSAASIPSEQSGLIAQLKIQYSNRPQEKEAEDISFAFEISSDKLEVLIHELSTATKTLESLQS